MFCVFIYKHNALNNGSSYKYWLNITVPCLTLIINLLTIRVSHKTLTAQCSDMGVSSVILN